MKKRVIPAIIIVAVTVACVAACRPTRVIFFALASAASVWEMRSVLRHADMPFFDAVCYAFCLACAVLCWVNAPVYALVGVFCLGAFAAFLFAMKPSAPDCKKASNTLFVLMYPCMPFALILYISSREEWLPVLAIAVIGAWVCDSAALAVGKKWGRHKVAPKVSPNKTVEGCIGGTASSVIIGAAAYFAFRSSFGMTFAAALVTSVVCTSFGQVGDLAASLVKRMAGVKDFSRLIPEHGGVMDKFDSMLFAIPSAWFCLRLFSVI